MIWADSSVDCGSVVQGRLGAWVVGQGLYSAPLEDQSGELGAVNWIAGVELHCFVDVISTRRVSTCRNLS